MYLQRLFLSHFSFRLLCHSTHLISLILTVSQPRSYDTTLQAASLWRHTTLHSGLAGVGAGQCHRNPVEGIFSRDFFSYINLQTPSIFILSQYPQFALFHRSFTFYSIQVPGPPVVHHIPYKAASLLSICFSHSFFAMGVLDAILTASKLVASLSQTATNGTAFIIFPSKEEFQIDVET